MPIGLGTACCGITAPPVAESHEAARPPTEPHRPGDNRTREFHGPEAPAGPTRRPPIGTNPPHAPSPDHAAGTPRLLGGRKRPWSEWSRSPGAAGTHSR